MLLSRKNYHDSSELSKAWPQRDHSQPSFSHTNESPSYTSPLRRAASSGEELFLSVVMEWQKPLMRPMSDARSSIPSSSSVSNDSSSTTKTGSHHKRPRVRKSGLEPDLHLEHARSSSTSTTKKIGIYSPRSRQKLLKKFMIKRARRLSQKTVRYDVRKTLANARPRVKGRFVKTDQTLTAMDATKGDTNSVQDN